MSDTRKILRGVGQQAEGLYKVMVVESATDKVVYESEWQKNLILNQGMDEVAARLWCALFTYGICGTGTQPNSITSGGDTAAQVGTTVTRTGSTIDFNTDATVGDMIKWSTNEEARITSITSAGIVEVTPSQAVTDTTFTIWKTARVGLQVEVKRSNTYLAGAGNCETLLSVATLQNRRTYDFSVESGDATYTEVGVGWASSAASTVFSRILLNTPVSLVSGQRLRLVYQLNVTLSPSASTSKTLSVSGWTGNTGAECIQNLNISNVSSAGATNVYSFGNALDPASTNSLTAGRMFCVSTNSSALAAFGSAANRTTTAYMCSAAPTNASYVAGSHQLDVSSTFAVADAVSASIRSVMLGYRSSGSGYYPYDTGRQSFTFLFDSAHEKTNTQTLSFTVRFTWSRVLA